MTPDPRHNHWITDAGRASCAHAASLDRWDDEAPTVSDLAEEWMADPGTRRALRPFRDAADEAWAVGGPSVGGRLG